MTLLTPPPLALPPRPFQAAMIEETRTALRTHDAVLFQLPTGGGKTVVAANMIRSAAQKGGRPWFVCHRDFLVDQTSKTLDLVGVDHAFISAGRRWNPWADAQVCAVDTLRSRLDRIPAECVPRVLFMDEAHHACSATWSKVIRWALDRGCKVVGLSATPERLDGKGLDELFGHMVRGPSVEWLMEQGYLSKYQAFAPSIPDLAGVGSRGGDFKADEVAQVMDTDTLVGNIVTHYRKLADRKRAVVFCASIAHSQHVAKAFRDAGYSAVHLDGASPWDERRAAARGMAIGEIDVLTNVSLFGEGYDLAAQAGMDVTIEAVIMARPTQSLAMYLQQVGRALRPKDTLAVVLDHAGNVMRHGLPDEDREWTLEGKKKAKKGAVPSFPAPRTCMACFAAFSANARVCPHCGTPVPVAADRVLDETDDDLKPVDAVALKAHRKMQEQNAKSVEDLIEVGRARGYDKPEKWAAHLWTARARKAVDVDAQASAQKRW